MYRCHCCQIETRLVDTQHQLFFCSPEHQQNYEQTMRQLHNRLLGHDSVLRLLVLSNGGKRQREEDLWSQSLELLPADVIGEILLHILGPLSELKYDAFQELLQWRNISYQLRGAIDQSVLSLFREVPWQVTSRIELHELLLLTNLQKLNTLNVNHPSISAHHTGLFTTLRQLTQLVLGRDTGVYRRFKKKFATDRDLAELSDRLQELTLPYNVNITDASVSRLTCLRKLDLFTNTQITNDALRHLTALHKLDIKDCQQIDDIALTALTQLVVLRVSSQISDAALSGLTRLEKLTLIGHNDVTNQSVSLLTRLRDLQMSGNKVITDQALEGLTALQGLDISSGTTISDAALTKLTALEGLDINGNEHVTASAVLALPRLKYLVLNDRDHFPADVIRLLQERPVYISYWF
jgi:hypothetical protein